MFSGVLRGVGVSPSSGDMCTERSRCVLCRTERRDGMSMGDVAVCLVVVTARVVLCRVRVRVGLGLGLGLEEEAN